MPEHRRFTPHGDLLVDPAAITWRPKAPTGFRAKFRRRYTSDQRQTVRAASDCRARADQARRAEAEAAQPTAAPKRDHSSAQPDAGATTPRPAAAAARRRPITTPVDPAPRPVASTPEAPANTLAAELHRARQRVAELEAELEHVRTVALDVQRRVDVAVGRRAA